MAESFSSNEGKIKKFDGTDFGLFKFKIKLLLEERDVWEYVEEEIERPVEANAARNHDKKVRKAMATICLNLEDDILKMVQEAKSPKQVFDILCAHFEKKTLANRLHLRKKFINASMKPGTKMIDHINEVKDLASQLKAIDAPVSEDDIVITLLSSLPPEYDNLITALESKKADELNLEFITVRLLHEEMKQLSKQEGESSAMAAKSAAPKAAKNREAKIPGMQCKICKQAGHKDDNCFYLEKNKKRRPPWFLRRLKREAENAKAAQNLQESDEDSDVGVIVLDEQEEESETVLSANTVDRDESWYIDSGASKHMCIDRKMFTEYKEFEKPRKVRLGDGRVILAYGEGVVKMSLSAAKDESQRVKLQETLYVPDLKQNLFSVKAATRKGLKVVFESNGCKIYKESRRIGKGVLLGGLYKLLCTVLMLAVLNKPAFGSDAAYVSTESRASLEAWHLRLGHLNYQTLRQMPRLVEGMTITDFEKPPPFCDACAQAKLTRKVSKAPGTRATRVLELVHSDVCGPIQPESIGRAKSFVTFIDDFSRYVNVYFIHSKDQVFEKFREFVQEVTTRQDSKIKTLRTDGGGEYASSDFTKFLIELGIRHESSLPYTPEQNGVAERMNRTLVESTKAMLMQAKMAKAYWAEALLTAAYIRNRSPTTALNGITPYEAWNGKKPDVSNLRPFGCKAFAHVPKEQRKKLDAKGVECRLLGYCDTSKGYRLLKLENRSIIKSRDVVFDTQETKNNQEKEKRGDQEGGEELLEEASVASKEKVAEPTSMAEALKSPHAEEWRKAAQEEYESLIRNKTWELVELPKGRTPISNKWIFKVKYNIDDSIERFKARLVARGFTQEEGIDYDEVFSPVVKQTTVRCALAIAAQLDLEIHQMDVKTAFLNGDLHEEIYMDQPQGFVDKDKRHFVCKLTKSLYGLKQAARQWNEKIDQFFVDIHYSKSSFDACVYVNGKPFLIVCLYVDDLLIIGSADAVEATKEMLKAQFEMRDMGEAHCFLGLQIERDRRQRKIFIHQENYIKSILSKVSMQDCNPVATPMEVHTEMEKSAVLSDSDKKSYQAAVGTLVYAMTCTRPDISNSVRVVSQKLTNPTTADMKAVKRIFRYLKGTASYGILYDGSNPHSVHGFADADWAGDIKDRKSISGYAFVLNCGAVSWASRKQACVTLSSTEAEYVAASLATQEAVWMRSLMASLTPNAPVEPIVLYEDNMGCIALAKNPVWHARTKHIDVRCHFIREKVQDGTLQIQYCETKEMTADILTKALPKDQFQKLRDKLGVKQRSKVTD